MPEKPEILTVDDRPQNLYLLQRVLSKLDVAIIQANSGVEALALTLEHDFCVAIVDVQMPEMDGYELVELLRGNERTATLPVIFMSAIYSDEYHHRRAYDAGAVDFISKPFVPEILVSKVKIFLDLYSQRRKLQNLVDQLNDANAVLSKRALQLETSSQVGKQATSILDLDEMLYQVVDLIHEQFEYPFVGIWLLDNDKTRVVLQASSQSGGYLELGHTLLLDEGPNRAKKNLIIHVCRTREMHLSKDLHQASTGGNSTGSESTGSELALPLLVQQELLGVLDIHQVDEQHNSRATVFAPDDITALQTMADQIAIAIRNARLYTQVVAFNEHLEELVEQRTQELQRAYLALERMDKSKTDFIAIAAHELRTPLTLIRGYAEMLQETEGLKQEFMPMLQGIITGEERLLEVVNSMLDVTKIDSDALKSKMDTTNLKVVLRDVCTNFASTIKDRQQSLEMVGMDNLALVHADTELMYKLFGHLLVNAIKYTPDGGKITIRGEMVGMGSAGKEDDQFVQIAVIDSGVGIDPANQELIFEKFYQAGNVQFHSTGKTKFKGGGPGLGLAICRGIVKAHNGRIWAESAGYDEVNFPGSTFYVLLPVTQTN